MINVNDELVDKIIKWMQKRVEDRNADGALVGLSGGVDSSTAAGLIKKAFGENSLGVMLPSSGTITKDVKYGQKVASKFDLDTIKVNVKNIYDEFTETFKDIDIEDVEREYWPQTKVPTDKPQFQNISTRLRMMSLYHIAERMNYVVMGTSNKSEILTGYYTLYGDGATDMRPMGDLYKTEVWDLAEHIGVPQEIVDRPPSGGCRGDETDRDEYEFGIDYNTFDKIHEAMIKDNSLDEFDKKDIERTKELIEAAKNKSKIPTLKINR